MPVISKIMGYLSTAVTEVYANVSKDVTVKAMEEVFGFRGRRSGVICLIQREIPVRERGGLYSLSVLRATRPKSRKS
jgi:hypothetical protein